jgi:peptidoglycan/LPS O-acetylase OafA/YrhL
VIYLVHYGLIVLFAQTVYAYRSVANYAPEVTLTLWAVVIVLLGILVHLAIEQPLLRLSRRVLVGSTTMTERTPSESQAAALEVDRVTLLTLSARVARSCSTAAPSFRCRRVMSNAG